MKCKFCNGIYKNINTHYRGCKKKKEFDKRLDDEGMIETLKEIWFSGGMKVILMCRGSMSNYSYLKECLMSKGKSRNDWYKKAKILANFERRNKCRIIYDSEKDILKAKK